MRLRSSSRPSSQQTPSAASTSAGCGGQRRPMSKLKAKLSVSTWFSWNWGAATAVPPALDPRGWRSSPRRSSKPDSGRRRPLSRAARVDLPPPEAPSSRSRSPAQILGRHPCSTGCCGPGGGRRSYASSTVAVPLDYRRRMGMKANVSARPSRGGPPRRRAAQPAPRRSRRRPDTSIP